MKLRIGVIFGGASVEHEISIISANQVLNVLDEERYEVFPIYISKNKDFYYSKQYFDISNFKDLNKAIEAGQNIVFKKVKNNIEIHTIENKLFGSKISEIDVFFVVMHGTNGEDGTLQGMLESLDATYTFCDTKGAAVGQDKVFMKSILQANGVNVVKYDWFYDCDYYQDEDSIIKRIETNLRYPIIVKPANLGSSVGISIAKDKASLKESISEALRYENKIVVERVIDNLIEVNCAVLGDYSSQQTSAIEQVFHEGDLLAYSDKYGSNGSSKASKNKDAGGMANTKRLIPAPLSKEVEAKVRELAIKGFKALNLSGDTRIDFLIDKNTNEVYLNEVNTIPGSLAFYLWTEVDLPFDKLCDELIKLAIKRKRENKQLVTTFDTNVLEHYGEQGSKGSKNKV
ncbi:MAG: D-alanine--D-alanine ligase [Bacilli bacterium]|jgi:D-alanine-D-alanine ligase|nr:D-alanine--D-alanine ligase [Bacilli bacterium]